MDTTRLQQEFGGSNAELHVVSRQFHDLRDSGQLESDRGHKLTIEELISHLHDAPANSSLIERWNWWMGALEIDDDARSLRGGTLRRAEPARRYEQP